MRCFTPPAGTRFYAGVDLHARALFVVVLDHDGRVVFARNLPAAPEPFLRAVAPFRDGLLVACECMHCWYWLADACRDQKIPFVLGHAWAMKAVHGCKTKCDRTDAEAIARLLRGGNLPPAYAYPKERRGLRDLLRARLRLVRQRAQLYGHVHTARRQANLPPVSSDVKYKSKRIAIVDDVADPSSDAASRFTWPCSNPSTPPFAVSRPRSRTPPRNTTRPSWPCCPGNQPFGWDAGRARIPWIAVFPRRQRRGGGSGELTGSARSCPKIAGSAPKRPPKVHPTPTAAPPRKQGGVAGRPAPTVSPA
jgi:Transposase